jgi:hypothetical protein
VAIRPVDLDLVVIRPSIDTIDIRIIPHQYFGTLFSVELQNDLHTYRSNGTVDLPKDGILVSEEFMKALLIVASPITTLAVTSRRLHNQRKQRTYQEEDLGPTRARNDIAPKHSRPKAKHLSI